MRGRKCEVKRVKGEICSVGTLSGAEMPREVKPAAPSVPLSYLCFAYFTYCVVEISFRSFI